MADLILELVNEEEVLFEMYRISSEVIYFIERLFQN